MSSSLQSAISLENLGIVWRYEKGRLLKSCYGIDRQTGRDFQENLSSEFRRLRERATGRKFKPRGLLAIAKPKPNGGNRIICVPTIADRVLQFALLAQFRESLEKRGLLNSISYGLIRSSNRGVADARRRAVALRSVRGWVYKADIEKFFDNIPRDAVRRAVTTILPQRSLHPLILPFIDTEIEDGFDPAWKQIIAKAGISAGKGVRQGMPLSPYFAGMILRNLDRALEKLRVPAIRYVDDIVAFFETENECRAFHSTLSRILEEVGLSIGAIGSVGSKTRIYGVDEAASFLGMEIFRVPNGAYKLRISDACIQNVGAKFASAGDIDALLQKNITLPFLGRHLSAMEAGYLQAYEGAENHDALVAEIKLMKAAALENALEQALGEQVSRLGRKERKFLGIDR